MKRRHADELSSPSKINPSINSNKEICDILLELAEYEKNVTREVHKANAYRKAAGALAKYPHKVKSGSEARENIEGIGIKIATKIDEILQTGKLAKYQEIQNDEIANALKQLTSVSGIGPTKGRELIEQGIKTLDDLQRNTHLLNKHQIIGLKYHKEFAERIDRAEVERMKTRFEGILSELDPDFTSEVCGSFRRGNPTSGDMDVLITHSSYVDTHKHGASLLKKVVVALEKANFVTDTLSCGESKFMGVCLDSENKHRRLDIRLIPKSEWACALLYFTGSDVFNKDLRAIALESKFRLNEYCLRPIGSTGHLGTPVPVTCEQDVFDFLQIDYKPPHERNA